MPPIRLSETQAAGCIFFLILAPLAGVGIALINSGLGRSRNAAHAMMAAVCVLSVAACMYFVCGGAFQGFAGGLTHSFIITGRSGPKVWDWLGAEPWFFRGLPLNALDQNAPPVVLIAWFGMIAAAVAGVIPLGSGADRWRLGAICASTALLSGFIFPLFAHWTWGGGWLAQAGASYGLGRGYLDPGGSGSIHALGGLTALAVTWIIGPRRGKYSPGGMPMAIPGHNGVIVMLGCLAAFTGWLALNCAGAFLFAGVGIERAPLLAVNTLLSASAAALTAAAITRIRFSRTDASLTANGWIAGLVATSAGCAFLVPAASLIVGLVAGVLVVFSVEFLDLRLEVDDPSGSISVHGLGGLWGVLAVGLFGRLEAGGPGQILAQLLGVATLLGFVLPLSYVLNLLLNRALPQRVAPEGEHQGMDLYELGAGAYPEFITHSDEYLR